MSEKKVIQELFAFIAEDSDGEGIVSMPMGSIEMPLIGADAERIDSIKPFISKLREMSGLQIKLIKFTNREEIPW